ncbi:MAG TPA: molybdenum cofactor biosynthesis protein MoaE [Nitrososphaerales archaeon]|nr:molybdenum cofactor biosynthesis protein MoaE [Nitrososphaerales archaeon]
MKSIRITRRPIDPARVLASVSDNGAGGAVLFVGTVRRRSGKKIVEWLTYEVYREMAERRMSEIEASVRERWPVVKIAMVHRYGRLEVGEVSVAVAISCEHRAEAFEACKYAIDTIKRTLPMWKKELFKGGSQAWVKGTPIAA